MEAYLRMLLGLLPIQLFFPLQSFTYLSGLRIQTFCSPLCFRLLRVARFSVCLSFPGKETSRLRAPRLAQS
jgi:hypothetical protein